MDETNIVPLGIPLELFEEFLSDGVAKMEIAYGDEIFDLDIDNDLLIDYYNKFYLLELSNECEIIDGNHYIPIYVNMETKNVLSILELEKSKSIFKTTSNIVYFDFGNGEEITEIINFPKKVIENSLFNQTGFTINCSFGSVYFSITYMSLVLSNQEIGENKNIPFLIRKDCSIAGVLNEPKMEVGAQVELIKI